MRIEHIALWTEDLKRSVDFYRRYFSAAPGAPYINSKKGFESVFLTLSGGARIELMSTTTLHPVKQEEVSEGGANNHRNGYSKKTVLTDSEALQVSIPRDRHGTFEPISE
jgi:catechol 2,3-dioxygenase-like lactoylglutathione lyase family enzyme